MSLEATKTQTCFRVKPSRDQVGASRFPVLVVDFDESHGCGGLLQMRPELAGYRVLLRRRWRKRP